MSDSHSERVTYFAETDFRNRQARFGIKPKDRTRHMYIIGKTGVGKSTLLENMIIQDVQNGEGVAVIDPHGSLAEKILDYVPEERIKDVVYFAPFDMEYPVAFNVLEDVGVDSRHLVVSGIMSVFKKVWQDAWSARMEHILNNTLLALIEYPGSTLMSVNKMFADKEFRKKVVDNIKDPSVRSFWVDEFAKYTERFAQEATPAIQNKIGQYTSNPLLRNIIGQPKSSFDVRDIMDKKKIFILNLSKGRIGEQNMNLLGGLFVTKIYLAAMSRAELSQSEIDKLPPFYLYVDEFQNFANESFAQILSEARKYKLALTVANQYVTQMVDEVRDAILGNVGSMVTFRIGPSDADIFEKEFAPTFIAQDLTNLGFAQIYLRLMIDGMTSKPFSARTLGPMEEPVRSYREEIIAMSRAQYAKPRAVVDEDIRKWHEETSSEPKPKKFGEREDTGMRKPFATTFANTPASSYVKKTYDKPYEKKESYVPKKEAPAPRVDTPIEKKVEVQVEAPRPVTREPQTTPSQTAQEHPHKNHHIEKKVIHTRGATPSPKLKDLLSKLEDNGGEKGVKPSHVARNHSHSQVAPKEDPQKEEVKEKSVPPEPLPTFSKKEPSLENKAELKALLSRVLKKETPAVSPSGSEHVKTEHVAEKKTEHTHTETPHVKPKDESLKSRKEIPEDVLKKILSS